MWACNCKRARAYDQKHTGKLFSSAPSHQASLEGTPGRCNATHNPDARVCVACENLHPPMTIPIPLPLTQLTPPGPWFISEALAVHSAFHQFPLLHSSHCSECSPVRLPRAASLWVRILLTRGPDQNPHHPLNHSQPNSTPPSPNASPIPTQPLPKPHATPHPMQD